MKKYLGITIRVAVVISAIFSILFGLFVSLTAQGKIDLGFAMTFYILGFAGIIFGLQDHPDELDFA